MYETWYKMSVMVDGGLDITPVITHRFHYTEFEQGFEVMKSGESGKVILKWSENGESRQDRCSDGLTVARGGKGVVYRAQQRSFKRTVGGI